MKGRPSGLAASTQSYQKRNLKISRNIKSFVGSLDKNIGAPKYIASALRFFIWWVCFIVLQDWRKVRFEKKTPDLLRFKHCPKPNHRPKPNHQHYFSRHSTIAEAPFGLALEKRTTSSLDIMLVGKVTK